MQLMIYIYIYILLTAIFQEMLTLNAQQQLVEDLLILSGYFPFFYLIPLSFVISFKIFMQKETSRV